MTLESYDAEAREDIVDADRLRAIMDEIETILADLKTRIERLENA
jgi:hypothetical protein